MQPCLTIEQIEEYASGALSPEEQAAVEAHLERCPACREQLERHRARDEFLADVRRVYGASDSVREIPLDEVIPGYRIVEEIHRGGQGVVFKAIQLSTDRTVALKVILGGPLASEDARKRFSREVKLAATLRHPNIVAIHDSGIAADTQYIVMDDVTGVPITEYAETYRVSIADKLRLLATACNAVGYAHQHSVIHRDLKPSNILVNEDGEPVIVDFGLARSLQPAPEAASISAVSLPGQVVGSLPYLSPEQATGDPSQIDERTDIYALGVLLYELLTGARPPPVAPGSGDRTPLSSSRRFLPPSQAFVGLDHRLDNIVLKALERDKARRYRSAGDFAAVIRTYLERPAARGLAGWRSLAWRAGVGILVVWALVTIGAVLKMTLWNWEAPGQRDPVLRLTPLPLAMPPEGYHGHFDAPIIKEGFEDYWPGENPQEWRHFEGKNQLGSEGLSNLYVTRRWAQDGQKALRSRTGIGRSLRCDVLDMSSLLTDKHDRVYYQCVLHLSGTPRDSARLGFVQSHPHHRSLDDWQYAWANSVAFTADGRVCWTRKYLPARYLCEWPTSVGEELLCLVRVELDFRSEPPTAAVWLNGKRIREGEPALSACRKVEPATEDYPESYRLDKWGFGCGANYDSREPVFVDIDLLEIGVWDDRPPETQPAGRPPSPRNAPG